ncbi:hypothetical protein TNCV_1811061 [Trichonephila clavipes]|nr:hypothetical protein TNCV_1811061 [Trichonephila clavipes]
MVHYPTGKYHHPLPHGILLSWKYAPGLFTKRTSIKNSIELMDSNASYEHRLYRIMVVTALYLENCAPSTIGDD